MTTRTLLLEDGTTFAGQAFGADAEAVSYTHLRAHET